MDRKIGFWVKLSIEISAHIGPWVRHYKNESKYSFNKFHLVDDRKAIEVTVDGLYMISAQVITEKLKEFWLMSFNQLWTHFFYTDLLLRRVQTSFVLDFAQCRRRFCIAKARQMRCYVIPLRWWSLLLHKCSFNSK